MHRLTRPDWLLVLLTAALLCPLGFAQSTPEPARPEQPAADKSAADQPTSDEAAPHPFDAFVTTALLPAGQVDQPAAAAPTQPEAFDAFVSAALQPDDRPRPRHAEPRRDWDEADEREYREAPDREPEPEWYPDEPRPHEDPFAILDPRLHANVRGLEDEAARLEKEYQALMGDGDGNRRQVLSLRLREIRQELYVARFRLEAAERLFHAQLEERELDSVRNRLAVLDTWQQVSFDPRQAAVLAVHSITEMHEDNPEQAIDVLMNLVPDLPVGGARNAVRVALKDLFLRLDRIDDATHQMTEMLRENAQLVPAGAGPRPIMGAAAPFVPPAGAWQPPSAPRPDGRGR
jgi:hypothetical protein